MYKIKKGSNSRFYHNKPLLFALLLILLAGILAFTELTDRTFLLHDRQAKSGVIPTTEIEYSENGDGTDSNSGQDSVDQPDSPKQSGSSASPPSGAKPAIPTGTFISNHSPNLDGEPAPSAVQSICNTTPGATCYIEFRNSDGIVKTLPAKTVGSSGSVVWDWDVDEAGFTVGTWEVKAIASLNNQTEEAKDSVPLKVEP